MAEIDPGPGASTAGDQSTAIFQLVSPTLQVADWGRRDTVATTFAVRAGPLDPNVDYTFCVQTARSLTAAEAKTFQGEVVTALSKALRPYVEQSRAIQDDAELEALQKALADAVPRRDELTFASDEALLKPRDPITEPDSVRRQRNAALLARVISVSNSASARRNRVEAIESAGVALTDILRKIAQHPALTLLAAATARVPTGFQERSRYRATSAVALRLQHETEAALGRVATGEATLARPDGGVPEIVYAAVTDTLTLARALARLDSTGATLRDLRELTTAVRAGVWRDPAAPRLRPSLDLLAAWIEEAEGFVTVQRRNVARLGPEVAAIQKALGPLSETISALDLAELALVGSSATTYEDNATRYVSVDLGVLGAFGVPWLRDVGGRDLRGRTFVGGAASPYIGVNFYSRPVNKRAALSECRSDCFRRRASLTIGITTNSMKRTGVREDLFGSQNVIVAGGYRLSDYFRATLGAMLFKSINANTGGERVTATPATGLALDWDIRSTLGPVLGRLFPGI